MANLISVSTLTARSLADEILEYAKALPDGKAVLVGDVADEFRVAANTVERVSKSIGVSILAFGEVNGVTRKRSYVANPKTAKAWQQAQNK